MQKSWFSSLPGDELLAAFSSPAYLPPDITPDFKPLGLRFDLLFRWSSSHLVLIGPSKS
jgi:hypothetical protein